VERVESLVKVKADPTLEDLDVRGAFLRGLFDADGGIHYRKGRVDNPRIYLYNTDRELVEYAFSLLKELGVDVRGVYTSHYHRGRWRTVHYLQIASRGGIMAFYRKVGFSMRRKRERLGRSIRAIADLRGCRRDAKLKLSREDLHHLYWVDGLGIREISEMYGVTEEAVRRKMRRLNIPRRPRGWNTVRGKPLTTEELRGSRRGEIGA